MVDRKWVPPKQWYASLPTVYVATGGLITKNSGEILLVKRAFPGGLVDADEPPHEGCAREIREELGLALSVGALLVVGWAPPRNDRPRPVTYFLFDCGVLNEEQEIRLQHEELDAYAFVSIEDGVRLLDDVVANRLPAALRARQSGCTEYLPIPVPGR
jgi:8-oxo-dGTP diphosphatase